MLVCVVWEQRASLKVVLGSTVDGPRLVVGLLLPPGPFNTILQPTVMTQTLASGFQSSKETKNNVNACKGCV